MEKLKNKSIYNNYKKKITKKMGGDDADDDDEKRGRRMRNEELDLPCTSGDMKWAQTRGLLVSLLEHSYEFHICLEIKNKLNLGV